MAEPDNSPAGTVFLLGAGFSLAVSNAMPLMTGLGDAVGQKLLSNARLRALLDGWEVAAIEDGRIPLGNVEVWFSALTADQPFLTASENLQRRALAAELAAMIAAYIADCQLNAQRSALPAWLARLVAIWHFTQASVITLNYDTLIESTVQQLRLWSNRPRQALAQPYHILDGVPPTPPMPGARFGPEEAESFRLLKLHGSTNWFGRPEATDLYSVVRDDALIPFWQPDPDRPKPERQPLLAGLSPLIMPPTSNKAGLYANATMAGIWREARNAIEAAEHLVIFGYSLPPTDTSMRSFLAKGLREATRITVVDPASPAVNGALASLGLEADEIAGVDTPAFEDLLWSLEQAAPFSSRAGALGWRREPRFAAQSVEGEFWPIETLERDGNRIVLTTTAEPQDRRTAFVNAADIGIGLGDLAEAAAVIVRFPAGDVVPMDLRVENTDTSEDSVVLSVGHTGSAG